MTDALIRAAPQAFDAIAPIFDERFGEWASVAAQRRAVRTMLLQRFPPNARVLEIGGGTGEDAAFLAAKGLDVLLTDASPRMVEIANRKLVPLGSCAKLIAAEDLGRLREQIMADNRQKFDGAFSNFAPLNCVRVLRPIAEALSTLLKPGGVAMLVLFGTFCPAEMVIETFRGRPREALRRFRRGAVTARVAKREFDVYYHRRTEVVRAFHPWFVLEKRIGIGVAVPLSAAEPWISRHTQLLTYLEAFDHALSRPLATFGDHVLYQFRREP